VSIRVTHAQHYVLSNLLTFFFARKLLSSIVAYVVKHICLLDAHMCFSWWVVFSLVVCCTACLVLESITT
jgi:hypothetical protein